MAHPRPAAYIQPTTIQGHDPITCGLATIVIYQYAYCYRPVGTEGLKAER